MANSLLRSGDIKDFQTLGKDGKAVYLFASQIRESLKFKIGSQYADHLAIPQRNDQGNIIDWYIPFTSNNPNGDYDIIPWTAASDEEKQLALTQLHDFEQKVLDLGAKMAANPNLSGDSLLFSRLIYNPDAKSDDPQNILGIRFPSPEYVYIVNGIAVITFWGFVFPQQLTQGSLFQCLEQPKKTTFTPPQPIESKKEIIIANQPWWKRWWWWLLALLLLLLLLFLLRGCNIGSGSLPFLPDPTLPKLPNVDLELDTPSLELPDINLKPINGSINTPSININGNTSQIAPFDESLTGTLPEVDTAIPNSLDSLIPNTSDEINDSTATNPPDITIPDNETLANLSDNNNPNNLGNSNNQLILPPDSLSSANTDFLNGKWSVRGGIQDKATGKPLSLQYDFDQGDGKVTVIRSDGVQCTGKVGSGILQGNLTITSQTQAICSDNSIYQLPKIDCKSGNNNVANCQGLYDNGLQFPITIKR